MEVWSPDMVDVFLWFVGITYGLNKLVPNKPKDKPTNATWLVEDWYGDGYTVIKVVHQNYNKRGTNAYQNNRFAVDVGRVYDNEENRYERLLELIAQAEEEAMERTEIRQIARGPRA